MAAGSKGDRVPAGPRTGGPCIPPPIPPPFRTGAHALPPRRGREPGSHGQVVPLTATPPPPPRQKAEPPPPPPPSVVVGTRPASVTPADCSLAPCPGRACLAISPAGTCWVPQQQQQQQQREARVAVRGKPEKSNADRTAQQAAMTRPGLPRGHQVTVRGPVRRPTQDRMSSPRDVLERRYTVGGGGVPHPPGPPSPLPGLTGHYTPINNENHKNFASALSTLGDPRRRGGGGGVGLG